LIRNRWKASLYYIGLGLMTLGLAICVPIYTALYGLPIIVIAVIVILISETTYRSKVLGILVPIILWVVAVYFFIKYAYRTANKYVPITVLIPTDFNGTIRIVHSEPCGASIDEEDGWGVVRIPKSGIAIIRDPVGFAWTPFDYVFVDEEGYRSPIRVITDEVETDTTHGVKLEFDEVVKSSTPDSTGTPRLIHCVALSVFNPGYPEINHGTMPFEEATIAAVDSCRKSKR